MSFILNALRKSEQERRALESETLNNTLLSVQPLQKRNKTTILFTFLVIGNVFVIVGIVWFLKNDTIPTPEKLTQNTLPAALPASEKKPKSKTVPQHFEQDKLPKTELKTMSIAELIEAQKPELIVAPLPAKPIALKKPVPEVTKQAIPVNKPEPAKRRLPEPNTVAKANPVSPEIPPEKPAIPFLNDLPLEFRLSVPKMNINVFVYSEHPEERFVMIDMIKYKPGQNIKDTLLLKDILPVSLLVVYENQEFQIKRP